MKVSTRAAYEVARPIEEVFDFATACDGFQVFLFPFGPIPGVAGSRMIDVPQPALLRFFRRWMQKGLERLPAALAKGR